MSKIVGITIDIAGKTSGLVSSLKEADASLSKTNQALAAVNKSLKFDSSNVDLLKSKEDLLTKAVADTSTKLEVLKQTAAQAMETMGKEGGATTEQVAQLQAEISNTERTLNQLKDEARATGDQLESAMNAQTVEELESAIADTETELQALKQQAAEAMQTLGTEGGASREEVDALNAQIADTETKLSGLKMAAADAGGELEEVADPETVESIGEMGDASEETGADFSTLEGTVTAASGALSAAVPIAGAVVGALAAIGSVVTTVIDALKKVASVCIEAAQALAEKFLKALQRVTQELESVLKKLTDFTKSGGDYADTVNTMAKQTGLSTEAIQEYMYAAELVDVSVETLTGSMTKNEKAMVSAASGSKATAEAYDKLGVSVVDADGNLRDNKAVFWEVIDALGKVTNETERDTTAMSLLGKSAKELNPLILAGSDSMKKYAEEAHQAGAVLDSDTLGAFQAFDDNLVRLSNGTQAAENALGLVLLPLLTQLSTDGVDALGQFTNGVLQADGDIQKIGEVITATVPQVLDSLIKNLPEAVSIINALVKTTLQTVIDNLPAILSALHSVAVTIGNTLLSKENLSQVLDAITEIVTTTIEFFAEHAEELTQIGVTVIIALIEGLARALPQILPPLANAIVTIIDTLTAPENVEAFINAMALLIVKMAEGISLALPRILENIGPLIDAIVQAIVILAPLLLDAGITIFKMLLNNEALQKLSSELSPKIMELITIIAGQLYQAGQELLPKVFSMIFNAIRNAALTWGQDIIKSLMEGIASKKNALEEGLKGVAGKIKSFLGFSEPEEGPLSDFHTYAPDMIDLWDKTMLDSLPKLESSMNVMAGTISDGAQVSAIDYTSRLDTINGTLAGLSGNQEIAATIPVYIGSDCLGVAVSKANMENAYISGGH